MAKSVPVRCPECGREHTYTPPVYPCDCGTPVALPVRRDASPSLLRHRTWEGTWVAVRCGACGTSAHWPHPELGCDCGTLMRLPVVPTESHGGRAEDPGGQGDSAAGSEAAEAGSAGNSPAGYRSSRASGRGVAAPSGRGALRPHGSAGRPDPRPAFQPVTIRTAQDARTAAAEYLRWLGFAGVRVTEKQPASGIDLRGGGLVAHVDPSTAPTVLREVETLWLNGLNEEAGTACFSLAGYTREARTRADTLGVALFVLDLTGMPQAVNDPADELIRSVC
jgi:hypothetical protein